MMHRHLLLEEHDDEATLGLDPDFPDQDPMRLVATAEQPDFGSASRPVKTTKPQAIRLPSARPSSAESNSVGGWGDENSDQLLATCNAISDVAAVNKPKTSNITSKDKGLTAADAKQKPSSSSSKQLTKRNAAKRHKQRPNFQVLRQRTFTSILEDQLFANSTTRSHKFLPALSQSNKQPLAVSNQPAVGSHSSNSSGGFGPLFGDNIPDTIELRTVVFERLRRLWQLIPKMDNGTTGVNDKTAVAASFDCTMVLMRLCKVTGLAYHQTSSQQVQKQMNIWYQDIPFETFCELMLRGAIVPALTKFQLQHSFESMLQSINFILDQIIDTEELSSSGDVLYQRLKPLALIKNVFVGEPPRPTGGGGKQERDTNQSTSTTALYANVHAVGHMVVAKPFHDHLPKKTPDESGQWMASSASDPALICSSTSRISRPQQMDPSITTNDNSNSNNNKALSEMPSSSSSSTPDLRELMASVSVTELLREPESRLEREVKAVQEANWKRKHLLRKYWRPSALPQSNSHLHAISIQGKTQADAQPQTAQFVLTGTSASSDLPPPYSSISEAAASGVSSQTYQTAAAAIAMKAQQQQQEPAPHATSDVSSSRNQSDQSQRVLVCGRCAMNEAILWCASCFAVYCANCWSLVHPTTVDLSSMAFLQASRDASSPLAPTLRPLSTTSSLHGNAPPMSLLYLPTRASLPPSSKTGNSNAGKVRPPGTLSTPLSSEEPPCEWPIEVVSHTIVLPQSVSVCPSITSIRAAASINDPQESVDSAADFVRNLTAMTARSTASIPANSSLPARQFKVSTNKLVYHPSAILLQVEDQSVP